MAVSLPVLVEASMPDLNEQARRKAEQDARNGRTGYDNSQDHLKTAQQRQADQKAWADANKKK